MNIDSIKNDLAAFIATPKNDYEEIGTMDEDVFISISNLVNKCAKELMLLYSNKKQPTKKQKQKLLAAVEDEIINGQFDTADREVGYELVHRLAKIAGIDSEDLVPESIGFSRKDEAKWMKELLQQRSETTKITTAKCIECNQAFELKVWGNNEAEKGGWFITECEACINIDYFEIRDNFDGYAMDGFNWIEFLDHEDFTLADVQFRVEQLIMARNK